MKIKKYLNPDGPVEPSGFITIKGKEIPKTAVDLNRSDWTPQGANLFLSHYDPQLNASYTSYNPDGTYNYVSTILPIIYGRKPDDWTLSRTRAGNKGKEAVINVRNDATPYVAGALMAPVILSNPMSVVNAGNWFIKQLPWIATNQITNSTLDELGKKYKWLNNPYVRATATAASLTGGNILGNSVFGNSAMILPELKQLGKNILGFNLMTNMQNNNYYGVKNPYVQKAMETGAMIATDAASNLAKDVVGNLMVRKNVDLIKPGILKNIFQYNPDNKIYGSYLLSSGLKYTPFAIGNLTLQYLDNNGVNTNSPLWLPAMSEFTYKFGRRIPMFSNNVNRRMIEGTLRGMGELEIGFGGAIRSGMKMVSKPNLTIRWLFSGNRTALDNIFSSPYDVNPNQRSGYVNTKYQDGGRRIVTFNVSDKTSANDPNALVTDSRHLQNGLDIGNGITYKYFKDMSDARNVLGGSYNWFLQNHPEMFRTINSGYLSIGTGKGATQSYNKDISKASEQLLYVTSFGLEHPISLHKDPKESAYNAINTGGDVLHIYTDESGNLYAKEADVYKFDMSEKGGGGYVDKYLKKPGILGKVIYGAGKVLDAGASTNVPIYYSEDPRRITANQLTKLTKPLKGERTGKKINFEKYNSRMASNAKILELVINSNEISRKEIRDVVKKQIEIMENSGVDLKVIEELKNQYKEASKKYALSKPFNDKLFAELKRDGILSDKDLSLFKAGNKKSKKNLERRLQFKKNKEAHSIIRIEENGKIKLLLPSHSLEAPREFVLEPQGDNKYYIHMRTWDGEKIPAKISNKDKLRLFEATYNELPQGAEILIPKSNSEYLATRGTIAGLLKLSRDSRFIPGVSGSVQYSDKDGSIKTFNTTSFIKK